MRFARTPPITLLTRLTQLIESPCALNFRQSSWLGGWGVAAALHCNYFKRRGANMFAASTTTRIEHVVSYSNVLHPPFPFTFFCSLPAQRDANGTLNRGSSLKLAGKLLIRFIVACLCFLRRTCAK